LLTGPVQVVARQDRDMRQLCPRDAALMQHRVVQTSLPALWLIFPELSADLSEVLLVVVIALRLVEVVVAIEDVLHAAPILNTVVYSGCFVGALLHRRWRRVLGVGPTHASQRHLPRLASVVQVELAIVFEARAVRFCRLILQSIFLLVVFLQLIQFERQLIVEHLRRDLVFDLFGRRLVAGLFQD